jgi:hypothetical protein
MRRGLWVGGGVLALGAFACLAGLLTTGLRLAVAGLSPGHGLFVVPVWHSILTGLIVAAIGVAAVVVFCVAAYVAASRRWDFHGEDWDEIARKGVGRAWNDLNEPSEEGQHRRAARDARFNRTNNRGRARRQRRLAGLARAVRLGDAAKWHDRAAVALEAAAHKDNELVHVHTEALPAGSAKIRQTGNGDRLLRILAGFNVIVLAGVLALGIGQVVATFQSAWWAVVPASLIAFLVVHWLLTTLGPLNARPGVHVVAWVLVAALAVLASPPVGLLVITGAIISTWGRRYVRLKATQPARSLLRDPLPWLMAASYTAVAVGYLAMPPVSFDGVTVTTASAQFIGGTIAQSSQTTHLLVCTPLADATSTGAYIQDIPACEIKRVRSSGDAALDSGERPTLPALALNLVGINWPPALVVPNLHERRPTCAGAPPERLSVGTEDPSFGAGAIIGPAPAGGRALDGEPPIEQTTDPRIARLARAFQPTIEVTVADRFWPVSVGAVLADIGPDGTRPCLVVSASPDQCRPITSVPRSGQPTDYLRFPTTAKVGASALTENPAAQFRAFEAGQHTITGSLHHWLADPGILDPWRTAQLYFYFAGPVHFGGVSGQLPAWPTVTAVPTPLDERDTSDGLIGLEYWFFYPYNYYPLVVRSSLMNGAPVAGDVENVDLHQGDWEHATVLLDARTLKPVALYMARHSNEGRFYSWHSPLLPFHDGHPIVQAAIGGHPTYPAPTVQKGVPCGSDTRTQGGGLLDDWLVCGSGRYVFRAATTPLVDLAHTGWACWPGHFGEAKPGREVVKPNADTLTTYVAKYVHVAGPVSPLWQAENGSDPGYGVCKSGAQTAEQEALKGPLAPVLTSHYG